MGRKFFLLYYNGEHGERRKKIYWTDRINFKVIHESVKQELGLDYAHLEVFDNEVGDYIDLESDADLNLEVEKFFKVRIISASKGVLSPDPQIVPGEITFANGPTTPISGSLSSAFLNDISSCSSSPTSGNINSPPRQDASTVFSSPTSSKIKKLSSLENSGNDVPDTRKEKMRSIQDIHRRLFATLPDYIDDTIDKHEFNSFRSLFKLTPKDNKSANNMLSLLYILERKDLIAPGKYEKLTQALSEINVKIIRDVMEPLEEEINSVSDISTFPEQTEMVSYPLHEQKVSRSPEMCSLETVPAYTLNYPGPDYQLYILLSKVEPELDSSNLDTMKFILIGVDETQSSVLEQISTPCQLFLHMIKTRKLASDNILLLQAILYHARKIDLYKKLMEYGETYKDTLHFYEPSSNQENRDAKFHVSCRKETDEQNLKNLRGKAAAYMAVDLHSVSITRLRGHK